MLKRVFAATVMMLALAGAAHASTFSWEVDSAMGDSGSTGGTHAVTTDNGDGSTIKFSGNPSPSILITGQTANAGGQYSNAQATYTYNFQITGSNDYANQALAAYAIASNGASDPMPIGKATGYFLLAGTQGSYAAAQVYGSRGGESASCDAGAYGTCGLTSFAFDVYYSAQDYCPGAEPGSTCVISPAHLSPPTISLTLKVWGDVYGGDNQHVFAFADPTITLNDDFFTALNLNTSDYSLVFAEGEGNMATAPPLPNFGGGEGGAVPEPATWAMLLVGFGGLGAVLRRRRAMAFA